jgi:endonuclease YncB( thermonuclease family)
MGCRNSKSADTKVNDDEQVELPPSSRSVAAPSQRAALTAPPPTSQPYILCSVYDGDTIRVRRPQEPKGRDNELRVRFLGVDTPELKEQEPFALEAKNHLLQLLAGTLHPPKGEIGTSIFIAPPASGSAVDKYDRILGIVYVEREGHVICVNESLLQRGLARLYEPTPDQLAPDVHRVFEDAQKDARKHKRAIWSLTDEKATVYTTTNGKAYHVKDCEHLRGGGRAGTVGMALDRGLAACRTCHA